MSFHLIAHFIGIELIQFSQVNTVHINIMRIELDWIFVCDAFAYPIIELRYDIVWHGSGSQCIQDARKVSVGLSMLGREIADS